MDLIAQEIDPLGQLIGSIGTDGFVSTYQLLVELRLGVRRCHVFSFSKRSRPTCVLVRANSAGVSKRAQTLASDYIGGDYHVDPLLRQLKRAPTGRYWVERIQSAAAQSATSQDRYFHSKYYIGSGIVDEIAILFESEDQLLYAGFCRQEEEFPFSTEEYRRILADVPAVLHSVTKHLEILSLRERSDAATKAAPKSEGGTIEEKRRRYFVNVRDALLESGCRATPREAEICAYIVVGYSTRAIAGILGISIDTVATHRKRAYSKLGVSRQNELFSHYVDYLTKRTGLLISLRSLPSMEAPRARPTA